MPSLTSSTGLYVKFAARATFALAVALVLASASPGKVALAQSPAGQPGQPEAAGAPNAGSEVPPSVAPNAPGDAVDVANTDVSEEAGPDPKQCMKANKTAYYGAAGMDAAMLLFFFLVLSVAAKRNWISTNPMTRFTTILLPCATAAAALSGFVIFEKGTVTACLNSADLRALLDVAGMAAWQRGMMLGMLPVLVLAFVIQFARRAISR